MLLLLIMLLTSDYVWLINHSLSILVIEFGYVYYLLEICR